MTRIEVLRGSLEKKQAKFEAKLQEHFDDVKRANGQPLNDKRNGRATMNRWDKQNESLRNIEAEIQKTKEAIEREEGKARSLQAHKDGMPSEIIELIEAGTLKQWGKYPHILFVEGVDRARIFWDEKKRTISRKFTNQIPNQEQFAKFREVFNALNQAINER